MKLAIPVWNDRISPVMDTARQLSMIELEKDRELSRSMESLNDIILPKRAHFLADLGVDVLICGAISRPLAESLIACGVTIIPWIAGDIDEVIEAFISGHLSDPCFLMPGCRRRGGGQFRRRRGHCYW